MKRLLVFVLFGFIGATWCAAAKEDGASFATAVVLEVKKQAECPTAEWAWIEKNLPEARRPKVKTPVKNTDEEVISFGHETVVHNGKAYSIVLIEMPDGRERKIHFDISRCFGK